MNSNLSVTSYKPSFGIKVNKKFIDAAHNYYNDVEYRPWRTKPFDKRVKEVIDTLGYEDFELTYVKEHKNGVISHCLYAIKDTMDPVLISSKDQFRKLLDKFRYINKHELYVKIHAAQVKQGLK
jgi:hypothetical protein